jgi:hypothetical protein
VVTLTYDAAGAVTGAVASGLEDPVAECVTGVATSKLRRLVAGPPVQRCALSFGQMPVEALPTITVVPVTLGSALAHGAALEIQLDGRSLGTPDQASATVEPLRAAVEARVKDALATTAPAVALHGPIVVRPAAATPMWSVIRVLNSVIAGGDDFVLARPDGALMWRGDTLPLPPVPLATGGRWSRLVEAARDGGALAGDADRVNLSILVTKDRIWVGVSRVMEFIEVPRAQLDKLDRTLKEERANAFFIDRRDVEIAGDDDATYGDILEVIAHVEPSFPDWQLADPQQLSARPQL